MLYKGPGLLDETFYRGNAPMTKSEVRAVTLSKLRLGPDAKALDIGAGSGSITIEMALQATKGQVWGIERKDDAYEVFLENIRRFKCDNIKPVKGLAPADLPDEMFDGIVVGGSGGQMENIVAYCENHLNRNGRLVINIITIENLSRAVDAIKAHAFDDLDVIQMQVSRGRAVGSVTMMEAMNPIYIISATRR